MVMSMGQQKDHGHSAGAMGHGGHFSGAEAKAVAFKGSGNGHSHLVHDFVKGKHSHSGGMDPEGSMANMPGHGGELPMGC